MKRTWSINDARRKRLLAAAIFSATLAIFWFSPIREMTDSKYVLLASQNLFRYHTFRLDRYQWPNLQTVPPSGLGANTTIYQIESVNGHLFYYFPPGTTVLSSPYVALMNALGVSATKPDGGYAPEGELIMQGSLAALLMATSAAIFFITATLVLPLNWSAVIALAGALGTQVWSVASRVMWSDTWGVLIVAAVAWLLLALEFGKLRRRLWAAALATLLAWAYFVRPTNSLAIVAITIYLVIFHRRLFLPYAATGAFWLGLFVLYSWHNFGQPLPNYFRTNRFWLAQFWEALAGNFISPSRGLLISVPVMFFIAYLIVTHWRSLFLKRLAVLVVLISMAHMLTVSSFVPWYGGGCFGPRYSTGLVPWFVLLTILGMRTMLREREGKDGQGATLRYRAQLVCGAALLALSIFINARGAISYDTWLWIDSPVNVDLKPERVWEWRYPQFLAGLIRPPLPKDFPRIVEGKQIDLASHDSDKFLWYGWSGPDRESRWTMGNEAAVIFAMDHPAGLLLRIRATPFLVAGRLTKQEVRIKLNGRLVDALILNEAKDYDLSVPLPAAALSQKNILSVTLPNASSPRSFGVGYDGRHLGIAVRSLIFLRAVMQETH
jgi:hypothetical protein